MNAPVNSAKKPANTPAPKPAQKPLIGIVDNDPYIRKALGLLLDAQGYAARGFASAEEYLQQADGRAVDCLLLDINLDGMSGIALQRDLLARGSVIPAILITGRPEKFTAVTAGELNCVALLHKPFCSNVLRTALGAALAPLMQSMAPNNFGGTVEIE